jgi:hypothetical protein
MKPACDFPLKLPRVIFNRTSNRANRNHSSIIMTCVLVNSLFLRCWLVCNMFKTCHSLLLYRLFKILKLIFSGIYNKFPSLKTLALIQIGTS